MTNSFSQILWKAATVLWAVLLLYLTLSPAPPHVNGLLGWDKLQHSVALGVYAYLVARACTSSLRKSAIIGVLSATLFGGLIELLQAALTINRRADAMDLVADFAGAVAATMIFYGTAPRRSD